MSTRLYELQTKVYKQLSSLKVKTFDYVPENTALPYITIGHTESINNSKVDEVIYMTFDVWSEARGRQECVNILNDIQRALEDNVELSTAIVIQQRVKQVQVLPNQGYYQGTIEVEYMIDWL